MHEAEELAALCFPIAKGLTTKQQSAIPWHFSLQNFIFTCFAKLQDEVSMTAVRDQTRGVCYKFPSRWSLFLLQKDVCCMCHSRKDICAILTQVWCSFKVCSLWRSRLKSGRRKLFVNCAFSEVRVKNRKNKAGSSGTQGRGSSGWGFHLISWDEEWISSQMRVIG